MNPYLTLKGGFMPNCVMESNISHAAKVCYLALAYFAGKDKDTCWPSQSTLAQKYGSNERSTREHLDELQLAGFIEIKQNGLRKSNTYTFPSLEGWAERNSGAAEIRRSGTAESAGQGTAENRRSGTAENRRSFPYEPLSYEPLSLKERTGAEENPSHIKTEDQNQNQTAPRFESQSTSSEQSTSYDLQLDETVENFVANAYRQSRGAKISKAEIKRSSEKLEAAEESLSREEFRTQLWYFLNTTSKWLRENKWPIGAFLKDPLSYTPTVLAYRASQAAPNAAPRPLESSALPETPVAGSVAEKRAQERAAEIKQPVYLQYVDKWNTLIPERPATDLPGFTLKKLEAASRDADFQKYFGKVCEKCRVLIAGGQSYTFEWLFTGFTPNWQGVLEGKFDWQLPKMSAIDQAIANAEREEREARGE